MPHSSTSQTLRTPPERPSERVSVQLVSTYPVYWTVYAVLRDFLQNFFDAAGPEKFASSVSIERSDGHSLIDMEGPGFAMEWLVHLGASTKTGAPAGSSAGYFGEGFKIAALCAVRDHRWTVSMGSRDWSAEVVLAPERIDGTPVRVLAYDLQHANPFPGRTWLRVGGTSEGQHAMLQASVTDSFLFDGNRLLGNHISSNSYVQVWERSAAPLPADLPCRIQPKDDGILFLGHQALATMPIPFVVSLPRYRHDKRDRPALYDFQMMSALADAAGWMAPLAAARLLDAVRQHWTDPLSRDYKPGAWSRVVAALVRRVASERKVTEQWREAHPDLLTLAPLPRGSVAERNRRAAARAWASSRLSNAMLVQTIFSELGYPTLERACEIADGFPKPISPNPTTLRRAELLEGFVKNQLQALFFEVEPPQVTIMDTSKAGWRGLAVTFPETTMRWSFTGRRIRFRVTRIVMPHEDLSSDAPHQALATYVHERCHIYGPDASAGFSAALTDAMVSLAKASRELAVLQEKWLCAAEPTTAKADRQPVQAGTGNPCT